MLHRQNLKTLSKFIVLQSEMGSQKTKTLLIIYEPTQQETTETTNIPSVQCTYDSTLHVFRQHDNNPRVLLPDHSPEVNHGIRQRRLARYVVVTDVAWTLQSKQESKL